MTAGPRKRILIGVDTGGTFTDFVVAEGARLRVHKVLSTPDAPERAILQGIRELGLPAGALALIHGSTVATNAVLEGKGVRTLMVTNRGFTDLLTIGRQARSQLYNLQPPAVAPPVPAEACHGTGGRLGADGTVLEPLTEADLADLRRAVEAVGPGAVAVNLLFSYLDDRFERRIAEVLPRDLFVSLSSEVLPEIREYERGMATWLNAYVGPLVEGYVRRLQTALPGSSVSVMQSSGDTVSADQAAGQAVRMLLSGPAGGLVGAAFVAGLGGHQRLLSFDMGGTSTDVALIEGRPGLTTEGRIGPYPVAVPMVDMHTIGAGGGSIARLDAGGMLQVGPQSAGAFPGPACYGLGGDRPTVTDANLVLGRLRADAFLGGAMRLDQAASEGALDRLAASMGCSRTEAAQGIIAVADEHMARALRAISVQRGEDPRDFTLVSFGGAGGLHVCALAQALDMREALVPTHAGVLSALGMLATRPGRRLSRTLQGRLDELDAALIEETFAAMEQEGRAALAAEGVDAAQVERERSADLRYVGQSYTLDIPWRDAQQAARRFAERHRMRYGHSLEMPVEVVNLRLGLHGPDSALELATRPEQSPGRPADRARVAGIARPVPVYRRADLARGQRLQGPAIITEQVSTTWIAPGWTGVPDAWGNLRLSMVE